MQKSNVNACFIIANMFKFALLIGMLFSTVFLSEIYPRINKIFLSYLEFAFIYKTYQNIQL